MLVVVSYGNRFSPSPDNLQFDVVAPGVNDAPDNHIQISISLVMVGAHDWPTMTSVRLQSH